jgi:hypothetical protein
MSKINRYTVKELDFIRRNAADMRPKELAQILGRSRQSIEQQAKKMNIKLKDYKRQPECIKDQKFGKLTAIEFLGMAGNTNRTRSRWLCRCDCGKIVNVDITSLRSGNTTSCGCSRIRDIIKNISKRAYYQHLSNAKYRGLISYLSELEFTEIALKSCVYCGKMSIRKNKNTGKTLEFNSVDRRDNEPYYKLQNSQSVCFECQAMKMDMTHEEFLLHIERIFNFQRAKLVTLT